MGKLLKPQNPLTQEWKKVGNYNLKIYLLLFGHIWNMHYFQKSKKSEDYKVYAT